MASTPVDEVKKAVDAAIAAYAKDTNVKDKASGLLTYNYDPTSQQSFESNYIPGIDYTKYFDAIIAATAADYGPSSAQTAEAVANKAVWDRWRTQSSNTINVKPPEGKTYTEVAAERAKVQKVLDDQALALKAATTSGIGAHTALTTAATTLFGKGGTETTPTKGGLAYTVKTNQDIINNPKSSAKAVTKAQNALTKVMPQYTAAQKAYDTAKTTDITGLTTLESAILGSHDKYNAVATPYTSYMQGLATSADVSKGVESAQTVGTTVGTTGVGTGTTTPQTARDVKIAAALEDYKKKGYIASTVDSSILGDVQKAVEAYNQQKVKDDANAKAAATMAKSPQEIAQTRNDIANYLAIQALKAPKVSAEPTTGMLDKMRQAKGEPTDKVGLSGFDSLANYVSGKPINPSANGVYSISKAYPQMPPARPAQPVAQPTQQTPQLGLNLSQDYNTRMIQQDLAAGQELNNPGTYATGQFDPLYSGYLSSRRMYQNPNTPINFGGFGAQNAYDANPYNPNAVTGKAAGGYLDAQSVGQSNQMLQQQPQAQPSSQQGQQPQQDSNQLGLGSIPNMSQYTNYTGNPGITSPTQNTDDGGVGGISVFGQTNPVW